MLLKRLCCSTFSMPRVMCEQQLGHFARRNALATGRWSVARDQLADLLVEEVTQKIRQARSDEDQVVAWKAASDNVMPPLAGTDS